MKKKVKEAIQEYNKYRVPEAEAKLISFNKEYFKIEFKGSFCYSCGFYDYFYDLKIILKEKGLKTEITNIKEIDDGAIVTFKII
jgi:superoxide reductase